MSFEKRTAVVGSAESVSTDRQTRSAVPTAKLDVCDIKTVTANPDKIKNKTLNREQISIERTIFENSPKSFLLESFWRYLFSKRVGSADNQTRA